jgi:hypothetical protein
MVIFRPLIPPAALMAAKRASAPLVPSEKVEEALPVSEVMYPMVMLSLVTPGALAVLPDEDPVADPVVPPVVPPDELFDELLQAAVSMARAATMTAALIPRRFIVVPPYVIDGSAHY